MVFCREILKKPKFYKCYNIRKYKMDAYTFGLIVESMERPNVSSKEKQDLRRLACDLSQVDHELLLLQGLGENYRHSISQPGIPERFKLQLERELAGVLQKSEDAMHRRCSLVNAHMYDLLIGKYSSKN